MAWFLIKYGDVFVIIDLSRWGVVSLKTKAIVPPLVGGLGVLSKRSLYTKFVCAQDMPSSLQKGILQLVYRLLLYCIVVGSRRLMPSDALHPKAYCTKPGLQSFLVAPPGVSTRDPSSERRNYLGNFDRKLRLPRIQFRVLLHAANIRHGTNGFTSLPKEGVLRIFSPWKIRRLR